ncbi:fimbrial protein [Burkholderia cenocepacia]|nr:fimbrial protein [Burkholderia cenocepacia]
MILNTMRKLILFGLTLSASLAWSNAFAACTLLKPSTTMEKTITIPAKMSIKAAKIGEVMASATFLLWDTSEGYNCDSYTIHYYNVDTGLELSSYSKVYKTGIPGVGIRFHYGSNTTYLPAWSNSGTESNPSSPPTKLTFQLIRIDTGVASGTLSTNFKVTHSAGGLTYTVKSTGSTEVVNDVLFTGCEGVDTVVNVQMGQETTERVKLGRVAQRPFNFDVRCTGLKPTTTAPVKVYFAGNSSGDGLLALSGAGTEGVASGMGISLVDDKGVKLPFDKSRSIKIDHFRSDVEGEIYRFSGVAKYVLTTGAVKAGKADATMTYVIEYN